MTSRPRPIAITHGDAAGIGPEIIAKLYRDSPESVRDCVVVGDAAVMQRALQLVCDPQTVLGIHIQPLHDLKQWRPQTSVLQVMQMGEPLSVSQLPAWGQISAQAGRLAADAVIWAADAALQGEISALVTAPINKAALSAAGVLFPGHTELLQDRAAKHAGVAISDMPVRMMLANRELRTVLTSIHVSLRQAIEAVTTQNIVQTIQITHEAERLNLGRAPHIAVAGLNPHAGEGGLMGREEIDIILPAIEQAKRLGIQVSGPYPPDTVFMRARTQPDRAGEFDVVVCMYHDQGLIPVKYLGVEHGVNLTLGLPLIRTSPDHGTAFNIAALGVADPSSLREALEMARRLVSNRLLG